MEIVLNGEKKTVESTNLAELLLQMQMHELRCATLLNGRIIRRTDRSDTPIQAGDQVEVITMVGGG
jgi:sulfur carrier protein